MTRALLILTPALLGASLIGAAYAQTKSSGTACGPEVWSADKMTYVSVPCAGGQENAATGAAQTAKAPGAAPCGVETWSSDKMAYVNTPCAADITPENPGYSSK